MQKGKQAQKKLASSEDVHSTCTVGINAKGAEIGSLFNCFVFSGKMVRPERFELPTYWFVASRSIQLS
jgi:hypothetical protein